MNFDSVVVIKKLDETSGPSQSTEKIVSIIKQVSDQAHIPVFFDPDKRTAKYIKTLFIAVGGDGTMLYTLKKASAEGGFAIGINTGKVGFLSELVFDPGFLASELVTLLWEPLIYDKRMMLFSHVSASDFTVVEDLSGDDTDVSVNELSIAPLESDTIMSFDLYIDDQMAGSHKANSVLISTPTGSTAYSLSAGGAILHPSLDAIEIVPVASLRMASRPIVVPGQSEVRVVVKPSRYLHPIVLRSDGQKVKMISEKDYSGVVDVSITSKHTVNVLHTKHYNFFEVLSTKMGWLS